jgi:putative copper resistance protein D
LYYLNVTIHVLAALLWLGGMFFLAVVGAPVLRKVDPPELRARLFNQLGLASRNVGWAAIGVLILTGVANLHFRGLLRWAVLGNASFWSTRYGTTLAFKLSAVLIMIVVSAVHDFILGPRAYSAAGTPAAGRWRRWSSWLARVNAVVGVLLVYFAVRLARGG